MVVTEQDTVIQEEKSSNSKKPTQYMFNKIKHGKGRLVLAVVKEFTKLNKPTLTELKKAFPNQLQKYYGVVASIDEAKKKSENYPRFFVGDNDIIQLAHGNRAAVTTQWGASNIDPFIKNAIKLGFEIEETK